MAKKKPPGITLSPATAAKIGSILVHIDEWLGPSGHPFDRESIQALLNNRDVQDWLDSLAKQALLPVKRK